MRADGGAIETVVCDVAIMLELIRERSNGARCSVVSEAILHEDSPSNSV